MKLLNKVNKEVVEAISKYVTKGEHRHVVLEYQVKNDEISARRVIAVDNGEQYFYDKGFECVGFKRFKKEARVNVKHGWIIFETERIAGSVGCIEQDIANIESDILNNR